MRGVSGARSTCADAVDGPAVVVICTRMVPGGRDGSSWAASHRSRWARSLAIRAGPPGRVPVVRNDFGPVPFADEVMDAPWSAAVVAASA